MTSSPAPRAVTQPWQQTPQESGTTTPTSEEKASLSNQEDIQDDWKPSRHEVLVIITLAVTNLLVALDASIITTSLNVSTLKRAKPSNTTINDMSRVGMEVTDSTPLTT